MQNLAKNLRFYRRSAGLTQQELGERIAYSGKAISKWEAGHVFPPTEALLRLSEVLQVDLDTLFAFKKAPSYFLGVDGGGTKTKFVLTDAKGKIIRQTLHGPCNVVNLTPDGITSVLTKGVAETCDGISLRQIYAHFGLAGGASVSPTLLPPILKRFGFAAISYGTDAANIISAGLRERDGIVAILGTGSVVFTSQSRNLTRFGGYGYLLGDNCSGYELGKSALHAVLAECDGSGPKTLLTTLFEQQTHRKIFDALPDFYQKDKHYIASFAVLLFEAVRKGDTVATEILQENVRKFAAHIQAAKGRFDAKSEIPLVLGGSLTKAADVLLPLLQKEAATENLQIEILNDEPVMGALRLARLLKEEQKGR